MVVVIIFILLRDHTVVVTSWIFLWSEIYLSLLSIMIAIIVINIFVTIVIVIVIITIIVIIIHHW